MQQYFADTFFQFFSEFEAWELKAQDEDRNTPADPRKTLAIFAKLGVLQGLAAMHGFNSIDQQCQRLMRTWEEKKMQISCGEARDGLRELRQRAEDDYKGNLFLHLTPKQSQEFQNPSDGWEGVSSRFYRVRFNIEECGKCLALERYGAAVFHALQVAEYGVIQLAMLLQVEGDRPGWGSLKRLSAILDKPYPDRSTLEKSHSKLLEQTVHLAVIVRDNWRHKLDHVDNQIIWVESDFSEKVAREIISSIQAFMRKLAAMPQIPKSKFSIRSS